ncbi:MAG: Gfo/Idh/MocA family oxidoreductase [Clostridiaceae bacterium]|nr:Gfo/Idh/MocA family oxidoreductase [Clostridiaceae bacterium]
MNKLRVGIVGTGWVSDEYIKAFGQNDHVVISAIVGTTLQKAQQKIDLYNIQDAVAYDDYDSFIERSDVDIVTILTPNYLHAEQAIKAANAKKHIVIEKPLATSWEDMKKIQSAVHNNGVKTIVGFVLRFHPLFEIAKSMVSDGTVGAPFYAEFDYMHSIDDSYSCYKWSINKETAGSILQVGGCHAVDGLRWFMQKEAVAVTALSGRYRNDFEQDTTHVLLVKYEDGTMGKVCGSYDNNSPYIYNLKLFGEKGTIINNKVWSENRFPGQEDWIEIPIITPDSGEVETHPFPPLVDHFVDSIVNNSKCIIDVDEAMKTFEIIEAADRSAIAGGVPISLPLKD